MSKAEAFVKDLKNNAIFQMSLSSRELFHSNFLIWLAEDKNTQTFFKKLMRKCFGFSFDAQYMTAKRERKYFDFSIWKKTKDGNGEEKLERPLFVLENKFKSIPNEYQLEEYAAKVEEDIKQGAKAKLVLLTLIKPNLTTDNWEVVDYDKYIHCLRECLKEKLSIPDFHREIIEHYAAFVETIITHLDQRRAELHQGNSWKFLSECKEFGEVRLNDLWQKLAMSEMALKLAEKLNHLPVEITMDSKRFNRRSVQEKLLLVEPSFSNTHGIVQALFPIGKQDCFMVQQQGYAHLRLGIIIDQRYEGNKGFAERSQTEVWAKYKRKLAEKFELDTKKEDGLGFGKGKPDAYRYFYLKSSLGISETIEKMAEIMKMIADSPQEWDIAT